MLKYINHLLKIMGLFMLPFLLFSGCLKEGTDTIVLPIPDGKIPYSVIPENLQDSLRTRGLDIHEGLNPDTLNGKFLAAPMILRYASDNYQEDFYDLYMAFSGQNPRGLIRYRETQKRENIDATTSPCTATRTYSNATPAAIPSGNAKPPLSSPEPLAKKASKTASTPTLSSTHGPSTTTTPPHCQRKAPIASGSTATALPTD